MATSSGLPALLRIYHLNLLKFNCTTYNYNMSDMNFVSASPKEPVMGIGLRHAQSHHSASSGPATGDLSPEEDRQECIYMEDGHNSRKKNKKMVYCYLQQ